jgi:hypothetical protein
MSWKWTFGIVLRGGRSRIRTHMSSSALLCAVGWIVVAGIVLLFLESAAFPFLFLFLFRALVLWPILLLASCYCYLFRATVCRSERVDPPFSSSCSFVGGAVVRLARLRSVQALGSPKCVGSTEAVGADSLLLERVSLCGTCVGFCTCISCRTIELQGCEDTVEEGGSMEVDVGVYNSVKEGNGIGTWSALSLSSSCFADE